MATTIEPVYYCTKCKRTLGGEYFYTSNNLEKYPAEGKLTQCKKCITLLLDNWVPETYLWILEECDVPYVPKEWQALLARYGQNSENLNPTSIMGRYLSKMKLKQYRDFRWKDTQYLQDLQDLKTRETMIRQGFNAQEIDQAIKTSIMQVQKPEESQTQQEYLEERTESEFEMTLTEENKTYLRLKWGKYRPEEWVRLEQLYDDMMESYDIQSAGHIDTLKLICKTSLKANQLLDIGDVEGAQKMVRMYDGLMKSGKFTAAQNKAESGEYVDSVSELVAVCERDGFIPRYYVDGPQDKVDRVIQDMQEYTHTLITEEMHLGTLIERAVKQIEIDKLHDAENELDEIDEDTAFEEELFSDKNNENTDQDYMDLKQMEEEEELADKEYYANLLEEDEDD